MYLCVCILYFQGGVIGGAKQPTDIQENIHRKRENFCKVFIFTKLKLMNEMLKRKLMLLLLSLNSCSGN